MGDVLWDTTLPPGGAPAPARGIGALGPRVRHGVRRIGWGIPDQCMSTVTNFAVNIYIAHELGAVQYGAFALAFVTYSFALNASRGLASDPLLVRFSAT